MTDDGIDAIASLSQLELLSLDPLPVTDVGIAKLDRLKELSTLNLSRTQVSNAGLAHLSRLKKLRDLGLEETAIAEGTESARNPTFNARNWHRIWTEALPLNRKGNIASPYSVRFSDSHTIRNETL